MELKIAMETEKQRKQKALLLKETKGTEAEEGVLCSLGLHSGGRGSKACQ